MIDWVLVARLVRPQGRKGEMIADIFTDFPERFAAHPRVFLKDESGKQPQETLIEKHWLHQGRIVFKFKNIDSINDANPLRGFEVVVPLEERMPLEDEAVYIGDLVSCQVIDLAIGPDAIVGEIVDVERGLGGAPDLLVIRPAARMESATTRVPSPPASSLPASSLPASFLPASFPPTRPRRGRRAVKLPELLIPFAKKYLVSVNVANKRVEMRLPEGLTNLNAQGVENEMEGEES